MKDDIMIWGDLLAGGGGTTTGALAVPSVTIAWALNHSKEAIFTHQTNHPDTEHFHANLEEMDVSQLCKVDGLWASLECTNFSNAKGGKPRDADSRMLAYELTRYIIHCQPKYIIIENVKEFMSWGPLDKNGKPISKDKGIDYLKWINHVKSLGYINYQKKILNSADYGAYTSRRRYFGIFSLPGYSIAFPKQTHHKNGINGFEKWMPCKNKINLKSTGHSIFGRKLNNELAKHVQRPLADRSINRIIKGMIKHCPEMLQYIVKYYGNGDNNSSINKPLHSITTKDRHMLVTLEKEQFVSDHIWGISDQNINKPLNTICTKESKQLVTIEKRQFINQCYGNDYNHTGLEEPLKTIMTTNKHQLVTIEKKQFISTYYGNSGGHSLDKPLGTITTERKHALTTVIANGDFDIKIRFLTPDELGDITGFPKGYHWYGSKRLQTWMIGNAVPILMAKAIINQIKLEFENYGK